MTYPESTIAKAIVGFFTSLGASLASASSDGISTSEIAIALCGAIVVAAGVWAYPNKISS